MKHTAAQPTTPTKIVDALFEYIRYMGTSKVEDDGVPEDEMMANVTHGGENIKFDGCGSSPFISRKRLEIFLSEKLDSPS